MGQVCQCGAGVSLCAVPMGQGCPYAVSIWVVSVGLGSSLWGRGVSVGLGCRYRVFLWG